MQLRTVIAQKQIQTLKQMLAPKLIQMLKTFNLSYHDLVETIAQEAGDNVFLDVVRYDQLTDSYGGKVRKSNEATNRDVSDYAADTGKGSLQSHLMNQLELEHLGEKEYAIAVKLIDHIDDRGYLPDYDAAKAEIRALLDVADRKIHDVLKIIHTFEPDGVGARSLKECLLIQVEAYNFDNDELRECLEEMIKDHLDDLAEQKYAKIAKAMQLDLEDITQMHAFIRSNLTHNPGSGFSQVSYTEITIPSFEVVMSDGRIMLTNLEKEQGIQIEISDKYLSIINDPDTDEATRTFLKEKLKRAEELVDNLKRRHENLEKLVRFILNRQQRFIEKGTIFMEPLLQVELSKEIGISSSTVSRIVSSKYIQTPHGVFALKQLCPRSHFGKTAERLKLIIADVFERHPGLSDEKMRQVLKKEGLDIARRTIAKYRSLIGIKSSFQVRETTAENPDNSQAR